MAVVLADRSLFFGTAGAQVILCMCFKFIYSTFLYLYFVGMWFYLHSLGLNSTSWRRSFQFAWHFSAFFDSYESCNLRSILEKSENVGLGESRHFRYFILWLNAKLFAFYFNYFLQLSHCFMVPCDFFYNYSEILSLSKKLSFSRRFSNFIS